MNVTRTACGFELLDYAIYASDPRGAGRLIQASSAIGDYEDAADRPGTSFLWIGDNHHLNRAEVRQLVSHLQAWLDTGSLEVNKP